MTQRKPQFGLTLSNRGVFIGATIDAGATTIMLRLPSYNQDDQFERVTNEVLAPLRQSFIIA
jgi:hypothetical protein